MGLRLDYAERFALVLAVRAAIHVFAWLYELRIRHTNFEHVQIGPTAWHTQVGVQQRNASIQVAEDGTIRWPRIGRDAVRVKRTPHTAVLIIMRHDAFASALAIVAILQKHRFGALYAA